MKYFLAIFALVLAGGEAAASRAAQPLLELDAAKLSGHGRAVDRWGAARQIVGGARPVLEAGEGEGFLRFDGKDDFFTAPCPVASSAELTVFIIAAPRGNAGGFAGMFACAPYGANDYVGGLNVDFGPNATTNLSVVNVESAGSTGFVDLLQPGWMLSGQAPFGGFHLFTIRSKAGPKGTELFVDGILAGTRARAASKIGMEEIVIGGRLYSNDPAQGPSVHGFFDGDIAAVVVYGEALADGEREAIEQKMFARVPKLNAMLSGDRGHALETVANPPAIQMLMPGFTVHEMPVKLSNINNVRYRADGKLVALGYDGRIHLLTDTDEDGLEDRATIFWEKPTMRAPIGMALLPANDPRGDGVFVASKGKVSLFLDKERDGKADEEIVVATGWKEGYAGVDTTGMAVDPKDGTVYFSISCESFVDGYVRNPQGVSQYSTTSERGTVQRLAKDFSKRESIVTGVRFLCSLAFNAEGDLFAAEQEGATWLPNGNPLDELLEIVPGRHYGFPPRHPKHLPNVIDEPAVMEYGPQHQSTVGMVFNDSVNGGPTFGPARWKGDALITGESRGKIYRTKLVKTAAGYVADNQLIACLSLLTVDNCVTPTGDLVVACHSGPPDWGTGPAGEGKLFKVRYARPEVPQIARAWAAAPDEFRIAFDKPLTAADWAGARERIRIEAGKHVSAGDRFESIRPGYQVVRDQMAAPRRWVELQSLSLSGDQRTLILHVPRQTEAVTYAVTLPCPPSWRAKGEGLKGIEQYPEMDVAITLNGIEATLEAEATDGGRNVKVILPHANLQAARAFTAGSLEHEVFFARLDALNKEGGKAKLKLRGGVDTSNIFVPATQPGATLDWDISKDAFANRRMELRQDFSSALKQELPTALTNSISLELLTPVNQRGKGLTFALDERERTIRGNRLFTPWASQSAVTNEVATARTDVHGNWLRGKRLFFGQAACATCHTVRGEGVKFGPDLSNLLFRDRESVLVDITQPSATINPDHAGSYVKFKDGLELSGLIETLNDEKIVVRLAGGVNETRPRSAVETILPLKTSLMPEGLGGALSKGQMEDLLTFLLTAPMEPAKITRLDPPAPSMRTRAEVAPFLKPSLAEAKPMRILLCAGPKDHGVDEHDYPLWLERWSRLLALAENVNIATNVGFPSREKLANADVTVFFSANPGWDLNAAAALDEFQKRGGGLVYLHYAVEGGKEPKALAERIGLAFAGSAFRHGILDLNFAEIKHPITQGFSKLRLIDESYWGMQGDVTRIQTLADSVEDKQARPQLWTLEREKGRVFGCIPGHYNWTFDDPLFRVLVLRGIAWAGQEGNVDRFNELATIGARIAQ